MVAEEVRDAHPCLDIFPVLLGLGASSVGASCGNDAGAGAGGASTTTGGGTGGKPSGGLTEKCYPNGTCNAGLTCLIDTCVVLPDGGGGSTSSAIGGQGGTTSSNTGGTGGTGGQGGTCPVTVKYKAAVLSDSPAGYWRLNDGANSAVDNSGHDLNGTYHGGVTKMAPGALLDDCDTSAVLDGTSGYVSTGFVQTNVTAYSVEAWFETTAASSGYFTGPIFQDRGAGDGLSLTLAMAGNGYVTPCVAGHLFFVFDSAGQECGVCSTQAYNDGAWHHVVGTFSAAPGAAVQCAGAAWSSWTASTCPEFKLYVDGVSSGALAGYLPSGLPSSSAPLTGSGPAIIGYHQAFDSYWPGSLDEVAVYLTELPAARAHYHAAGY